MVFICCDLSISSSLLTSAVCYLKKILKQKSVCLLYWYRWCCFVCRHTHFLPSIVEISKILHYTLQLHAHIIHNTHILSLHLNTLYTFYRYKYDTINTIHAETFKLLSSSFSGFINAKQHRINRFQTIFMVTDHSAKAFCSVCKIKIRKNCNKKSAGHEFNVLSSCVLSQKSLFYFPFGSQLHLARLSHKQTQKLVHN